MDITKSIPPIFFDGLREIMLLDRSSNNTVLWRNTASYIDMYHVHIHEAVQLAKRINTPNLRVYMTVNSRSLDKAIREFKRQQIDADYSAHQHNWYMSVHKHFRHILMQPKQRKSKYFLLDIDTKLIGTMHIVDQFLKDKNIKTITSYETPNGSHIITEPFNMNMCKIHNVEVKTDALMLLYAHKPVERHYDLNSKR